MILIVSSPEPGRRGPTSSGDDCFLGRRTRAGGGGFGCGDPRREHRRRGSDAASPCRFGPGFRPGFCELKSPFSSPGSGTRPPAEFRGTMVRRGGAGCLRRPRSAKRGAHREKGCGGPRSWRPRRGKRDGKEPGGSRGLSAGLLAWEGAASTGRGDAGLGPNRRPEPGRKLCLPDNSRVFLHKFSFAFATATIWPPRDLHARDLHPGTSTPGYKGPHWALTRQR